MRRIIGIILIFGVLGACIWEAYRGALVLLLRRGQYALLERWGGEAFYVPALRHYASHSPAGVESRNQFYEWTQHWFSHRFSDEEVRHLQILQSGELALLLRRSDECRVVILDPDRADLLTTASERVDHNAWHMRWDGDWVFLDGGGTLTLSLAYHREGSVLRLIPTRMDVQGEPYFWGHSEFLDLDGDGVPEVISVGGARELCPRCGRYLIPSEEVWKLIDGGFQEWTIEDFRCPVGCKFTRSD
jgi:hypothetical protein